MKRILTLALAALLVFSLAACGSQSGGADNGGGTNNGSSATDSASVGEATDLTDTDGNAIPSGSASVSFDGRSVTISAAYLIDGVDVEITSGEYASASGSSDQVVFLVVNGGSLTVNGGETAVRISKTGSGASGGQVNDNYNFYGINSGIVVAGSGSKATISGAEITTEANGSNAVVSTNGASVSISNSTIKTTGEAGSRGLHATYGGTIDADAVAITTSGRSCASLATDRGGGTVNASNMTLETNGAGSPLIYSTGEINVSNSTGTAYGAQMVVVEGGSSANVTDCDFSCTGVGNRSGTSECNSTSHVIDAGGIFIYQSFSGDASNGTDYFTAKNSTFTVKTDGVPMFYVTNITAEITLEGNVFNNVYDSDYLFILEETDQWGNVGRNGGKATVTLTNQDFTGKNAFVGSSSSSLTVNATDGSGTALNVVNGTW